MAGSGFLLLLCAGVALALPTDKVLFKPDDGLRYQYVQDASGKIHLQDSWVKTSNLKAMARYSPDTQNVYHLFTWQNPTVSQPMLLGNSALVSNSNFNANRRTVVLIHGWLGNVTATVNTVLVPAFLSATDVNVIVVDWSAGASDPDYYTAAANTITSGESVARFIDWLNQITGATPSQYHLAGHSLGGQQVGIVGRNVNGIIDYITALDPAGPWWITSDETFRADDGNYTEVIHTNAGYAGYPEPLGQVDFYPNGGEDMPGCDGQSCDHDRCFYYFGESILTGGFTGIRCATYTDAFIGNCTLSGTANMGGLEAKYGESGIFWLETNAAPPFSRG